MPYCSPFIFQSLTQPTSPDRHLFALVHHPTPPTSLPSVLFPSHFPFCVYIMSNILLIKKSSNSIYIGHFDKRQTLYKTTPTLYPASRAILWRLPFVNRPSRFVFNVLHPSVIVNFSLIDYTVQHSLAVLKHVSIV